MENINVWTILGVLTLVLLIIFWAKRNAVWGGFTTGIIIGFIITLFFAFKGDGFNWYIIGKGAISGAMVGFVAELLGKVSDFFKQKN